MYRAGAGGHPAGTLGQERRQEHRFRADHWPGVPLLLLRARGNVAGAAGENTRGAGNVVRQCRVLLWRTLPVVAVGARADQPVVAPSLPDKVKADRKSVVEGKSVD